LGWRVHRRAAWTEGVVAMSKRVIDVKILAGLALLFTLVLLLSILVIAQLLDAAREDVVSSEIQRTYNTLSDMQTFLLMSETYGAEMACIAFEEKLQDLDASLWNLGIKLDQYRAATEEVRKSQYYVDQKKTFNEQQIVYMLLLRNLREQCNYEQVLIAFFYSNSADCPQCDDQAFVLTDLNKEYDSQIAIFSYDVDLNSTSVNLLSRFYKLTTYPCVVIDDTPYCGVQSRDDLIEKICERVPDYESCLSE
jgi:hypothetical protein